MSLQYSNRKEDITRTIAEASHKILSKHKHWKQRFWISSPRQKFFQKLSFQWPEMPLRGYGGPEHIQKALFQEIPMYICTGPQCLIQFKPFFVIDLIYLIGFGCQRRNRPVGANGETLADDDHAAVCEPLTGVGRLTCGRGIGTGTSVVQSYDQNQCWLDLWPKDLNRC